MACFWARAHARLARVFSQRCFYLFVALLGALVATPLAEFSTRASLLLNLFDALVLLAAIAAVGRTTSAFVLAVILACTIMLAHLAWKQTGDESLKLLYLWSFLLFCVATVVYLLIYVLRRDVLTMDKLGGAAAVYLMLGVMWGFAYALVQRRHPRVFALGGTPVPALSPADLVYFSLTVLTSTGFGDIIPARRPARPGDAPADRRHAVRRDLHRAARRARIRRLAAPRIRTSEASGRPLVDRLPAQALEKTAVRQHPQRRPARRWAGSASRTGTRTRSARAASARSLSATQPAGQR